MIIFSYWPIPYINSQVVDVYRLKFALNKKGLHNFFISKNKIEKVSSIIILLTSSKFSKN